MASRSMVATDRGARCWRSATTARLARARAAQAPALLAHRRAAAAQKRQGRLIERGQKVPRRLRRRQPVAQQQRQAVTLAQPVQVLGRLAPPPPIAPPGSPPSPRPRGPACASYRPPRNLDHLGIDDRRRPRTPEVLDQGRHPAMRRYRPKTDLVVELEVQTISHHRNPPTLTHQVKPLESKIPRHARESFSIRNLSRGMRSR